MNCWPGILRDLRKPCLLCQQCQIWTNASADVADYAEQRRQNPFNLWIRRGRLGIAAPIDTITVLLYHPGMYTFPYRACIFDLDGTVYLGDSLLPTAQETIQRLRRMGVRTVFLSNNPTHTRKDYARKLTRLGLPTSADDVLNASAVMVDFLQEHMPGAPLFVIGEAPLCRELQRAGFPLSEDPQQIQAVIASFDRTFTYRKLQIGFDALRAGARFFATNADRFCPVPGGGQPDAAAIIAALEACTGRQVEAVVGKPSAHMSQAILRLLGLPPRDCLMVGDRLETDIRMGLEAGMHTALALTGATSLDALRHAAIQPHYRLHRLADLFTLSKDTPSCA